MSAKPIPRDPEIRDHKRRLLAAITARLDDLYASNAVTPLDLPDDVARQMVGSVPRQHLSDESVGPFYDTDGVRKLLSRNGRPVSRQAIADRISRMTILGAKTADGHWAFPTFQFAGDDIIPELRKVLACFRDTTADGWAVAAWLNTPSTTFDGLTAVEWLRTGRPIETVLADAGAATTAWSIS